jgi:hypothetical protein
LVAWNSDPADHPDHAAAPLSGAELVIVAIRRRVLHRKFATPNCLWSGVLMMDLRRKAGAEDGNKLRARIEQLGPYQSLALLLLPASVVEPLKLIAVAVAGDGHWITGTAMIVAAYGASLLLVERLFRIIKPNLLTLPWFARLWGWFTTLRAKVFG